MDDMAADGDLWRWTESFMSDKSESLVIDHYHCTDVEVETAVSQWSPVLSILFAIYLCRVFRKVEKEVEGYMSTSLTDDCRWLIAADSFEQLCQRLERAGI